MKRGDFLCPYVKLFLEELGFTSVSIRRNAPFTL